VLDQRDFFDKDIANQSNLAGYYIVKKGDYVYNPRISKTAPVGPISKNNIGDGVMSPLYTVFRFNNYDNNFYAHYFNSTCWHHYMRQASSTGARHDRMAISNDDFMALPLPISSLEEQQKIADCLSSIDELISTQSQKVEALKIHKKGLMQQLFPREGETVPRLRFPEFRDAGEWEIHKIEEACEKPFSGGTPPTTNKNYYGGKIPFIRSGEIDKNVTELFLSDAGLVNSSAKLVQKGDVLVALYGANSGEVALGKINGAINQAVICLRSRTSNAFLYQYLAFKKDEITAKYLQGGQGNLSGDIIKSIELLFSKDLEQQKIASCLSSIDDLITTQSQKLETLKTHKKGLMQQLFPAADE
jgi:type I restriction enzyme S subunit